jgi:hypothetical protein
MAIDKAKRPKHYIAYGFFGPLCAECFELAQFIHVCTAEPKPTGWVRSTLAEEEATRVRDAAQDMVDVNEQRRQRISTRLATLEDATSECSSSDDDSYGVYDAGSPSEVSEASAPPPAAGAGARRRTRPLKRRAHL